MFSQTFKTIGAKLKELERFDFFYQGFILNENFKRVYLKTTFSKSMDTISQKLMHQSVLNFSDLFYTYLACA